MSPRAAAARADAVHRLQIGLMGLGAILLCVGVASIISQRAQQQGEVAAAPDMVETPATAEPPSEEPLTDAGVVPDLPREVEASPVPEGPVLPEQGEGAPPQP